MTRVDARALAAYVGGLEARTTQLDELASTLPRVIARDAHVALVRDVTDPLLAHAREGVEQLHGTPYEAIAWATLDDTTRAVTQLGSPTRGAVGRLARKLDAQVASTRAEVDATRRATFDADLTAGGDAGRAATDELVRSIDAIVQPGARMDGPDAAVVGDALAATSWRLPAPPELPGIGNLDTLATDAATDPRRAFDLQRLAGTWRSTLVDEFVPGPDLARQAATIADRGADALAPDDWRELVRLVDADPAGAYVRVPSGSTVADVAWEAIGRGTGGAASWNEHVFVEGMSLALRRADSDLGVLRDEARSLLRDGSEGFGNREWARLAELARLDPSLRVLPSRHAESMRDALAESLDSAARTSHPRELTPSGRYYGDSAAHDLAAHWRRHVFGVGANVRMRLLDGGVDAVIRGAGRLETAAGGFTGDVTFQTRGEATRYVVGLVGKATAKGIFDGVRKGIGAFTPTRMSAAELDAALVGGPIPARLSLGELRRFEQWRSATRTEQVSLLARMVARTEPTSMAESRTLLRQARKLPIDEATLSPGLRRRWREALALVDREERSLRLVGEYREGYGGHGDYASLGRLRSTLELIGLEFAAKAQVERATRVATASVPDAIAPAASASADGVVTAAADDAGARLDELLVW